MLALGTSCELCKMSGSSKRDDRRTLFAWQICRLGLCQSSTFLYNYELVPRRCCGAHCSSVCIVSSRINISTNPFYCNKVKSKQPKCPLNSFRCTGEKNLWKHRFDYTNLQIIIFANTRSCKLFSNSVFPRFCFGFGFLLLFCCEYFQSKLHREKAWCAVK